jgi:hypothetical protein
MSKKEREKRGTTRSERKKWNKKQRETEMHILMKKEPETLHVTTM